MKKIIIICSLLFTVALGMVINVSANEQTSTNRLKLKEVEFVTKTRIGNTIKAQEQVVEQEELDVYSNETRTNVNEVTNTVVPTFTCPYGNEECIGDCNQRNCLLQDGSQNYNQGCQGNQNLQGNRGHRGNR